MGGGWSSTVSSSSGNNGGGGKRSVRLRAREQRIYIGLGEGEVVLGVLCNAWGRVTRPRRLGRASTVSGNGTGAA